MKELYYLLYKPYGMLSQFSKETPDAVTLKDLAFPFPPDVYPVGRLDANSEGLLILTNDTSLNAHLLHPTNAHWRTYTVQVDGKATPEAVKMLAAGLTISVEGKTFRTKPCRVRLLLQEPVLPARNPPVRYRAMIPTSWLEISLTEGKYHQVRKMCAKAGFPVLRLVRTAIGELTLGNMQPGQVMQLTVTEVAKAIKK